MYLTDRDGVPIETVTAPSSSSDHIQSKYKPEIELNKQNRTNSRTSLQNLMNMNGQ